MASCIAPALRALSGNVWSSSKRFFLGTAGNTLHFAGLRSPVFQRSLCVVVPDEVGAYQDEARPRSSEEVARLSSVMDKSEIFPQKKRFSSKVSLVNEMIQTGTTGRLFCVVHISARQYKVTKGDIIVTDKLNCDPGSEIYINKVLLVGGSDFTLIGTPVLRPDLVRVRGTVIEHTKTTKVIAFKKKRRNRRKRRVGHRSFLTLIRINDINVEATLDKPSADA